MSLSNMKVFNDYLKKTTIETLVRHGAGTNRATVISGRLVYNHGAFNAPDDETADPRA